MEKIPVFETASEVDQLNGHLMDAIQQVLRSGQFIMGENVRHFEKEAAAYLGVKHAIAVNSGTDALVIALRAAGIGAGDEVITTPFTFFATAEAIHQVGASPVFVDIEEDTYAIDASNIEAAITPRTKAVLPVHLYGHSVAMDELQTIADRYGLKIIEDVAQAFGGEFKHRKLGTIGDAGCFSFFPTKNLGAYGDGGLIATNHDEIAGAAAMLRAHGSRKKYCNEQFGYNSRLDEIQAAILRVKLPYIEEWNQQRRTAAHTYHQLLAGIQGIVLPVEKEHIKHVYHQYTIRVLQGKRDELKEYLDQEGIGTMVYYPRPLHQLPVFGDLQISMPHSEQASHEVLSLPIWPFITREQQSKIAHRIHSFFSK